MRVTPRSEPSASITGDESNVLSAVALEEVQHDDDAELAGLLLKGGDQRAVERLGQRAHVARRGTLRMKPLERELRVARQLPRRRRAAVSRSASPRATFDCLSRVACCWISAIFMDLETSRSSRVHRSSGPAVCTVHVDR